MNLQEALQAAAHEVDRAMQKHKKGFNSPHEGFAILNEEVDELWDEVKAQKHSAAAMREEAVQVAAMALRFLMDCCDDPVDPQVTNKKRKLPRVVTIKSTKKRLVI